MEMAHQLYQIVYFSKLQNQLAGTGKGLPQEHAVSLSYCTLPSSTLVLSEAAVSTVAVDDEATLTFLYTCSSSLLWWTLAYSTASGRSSSG